MHQAVDRVDRETAVLDAAEERQDVLGVPESSGAPLVAVGQGGFVPMVTVRYEGPLIAQAAGDELDALPVADPDQATERAVVVAGLQERLAVHRLRDRA